MAALLTIALVAWLFVPPAEPTQAQGYGPSVTSDLKRFDMVVKTAGTHDLIAGVSGKKFRIVSLFVRSNSSTANNIYFSEEGVASTVFGTNSTDTETLDAIGISGKAGWSVGGVPLYETSTAGTDFEITLSGATAVSVVGTYVEVN
jgi:hypothetical protein